MYSNKIDMSDDSVMEISEFMTCVRDKLFIDYDGYGHPVKEGKEDSTIIVYPSGTIAIPKDATHINWYNR
jgi:hypothetical protein